MVYLKANLKIPANVPQLINYSILENGAFFNIVRKRFLSLSLPENPSPTEVRWSHTGVKIGMGASAALRMEMAKTTKGSSISYSCQH